MRDRINPYYAQPWARQPGRLSNLYFLTDRDGRLYAGAQSPEDLFSRQRSAEWPLQVVSLDDLASRGVDPDEPQAWAVRANFGDRANSRRNQNPDYNWFVVYEDTPTGPVIASGWEYKEDAQDAQQEGETPRIPGWSAPVVRARRYLMGHGVNPDLPKRWLHGDASVGGSAIRHNRGPSREKIEKQYRDFNHHAPKEWRDLTQVVRGAKLPSRLSPRAGYARIWYDSPKIMESGDRPNKPNAYVHCVFPQPDPASGVDQCVCGHPLGDHETVREFATVYAPTTSKSGIEIAWPDKVAFLGWSLGWDETDGDRITPVRFKRKALIVFSSDHQTFYAFASGKAYMFYGGEMRITPDGIAG